MNPFKTLAVASLLLAISLTMGCTSPFAPEPTYHADLDLRMTVSNASNGGHVLLPILFEGDGRSLAFISTEFVNSTTCPALIKLDTMGWMLDMNLTNKTCTGEAQEHIRGAYSITRTEEYLKYVWSDDINSTGSSKYLPVKAGKLNGTGTQPWVLITISFKGSSDMCSRNATFSGSLPQDGNIGQLQGRDKGACAEA